MIGTYKIRKYINIIIIYPAVYLAKGWSCDVLYSSKCMSCRSSYHVISTCLGVYSETKNNTIINARPRDTTLTSNYTGLYMGVSPQGTRSRHRHTQSPTPYLVHPRPIFLCHSHPCCPPANVKTQFLAWTIGHNVEHVNILYHWWLQNRCQLFHQHLASPLLCSKWSQFVNQFIVIIFAHQNRTEILSNIFCTD